MPSCARPGQHDARLGFQQANVRSSEQLWTVFVLVQDRSCVLCRGVHKRFNGVLQLFTAVVTYNASMLRAASAQLQAGAHQSSRVTNPAWGI
jgi:hypothetical protein